MIQGLSHITFIVKDLEKAGHFFQFIFDGEEVYNSKDKTFSLSKERFFLVGGLWIAIMEGEELPGRTYNHVAFQVREEDFAVYEARVKALGVDVKLPRSRVEGEGKSLYFYDYDNHLFEIHTGTLQTRLARYAQPKE